MLLEILGPLERLAAEVALVRLQGNMDADVARDVITLHGGGSALIPLARQVQVVGALATDMAFADVVLAMGCQYTLALIEYCRRALGQDLHRAPRLR